MRPHSPALIREWFRSPLVRLAGQLPLFMALILVAVLVPTYFEAVDYIKAQVQSAVEEEILGLSQSYEEQGLVGLVASIRTRVQAPIDPSAVYLLTDRTGRPLVGSLTAWPDGVPTRNQAQFSVPESSGSILEGRVFELPDGRRLLVARRSPLSAFRNHLRNRLALAATLAIVGCAALATLTLTRYRRRLRRMQSQARDILATHLAERLAITGTGDELDQLATEFNQAFAAIERLMDATRHVSSAIAHDMRRPISAIRYRLEELARQPGVPDETRAQLDELLTLTDDTLATMSAMLRLASLEAGSFTSRFEPVNLKELVQEAVDTYRAVAAEQGIKLNARLDDVTLVIDRNLIFQAVQNLLENGIKYGQEQIDVELTRIGQEAHLQVRDYGPGVDPESLPFLFERFYRADAARTTSGSGIGLTLVRAIAEAHSGGVTARNANPGLAVEMQLPIRLTVT
jgi:signal transduction histidine kinase